MPLDKDQLKRVSNLLNTLQVRTALESTNASPKRMDTYNLQRLIDVNTRDKGISKYHAEQLEKQGEQTDPVTKQKKKYSEKWLQSTGQQIPGLDSDGTSAMNALDVIGAGQLAKVLGQIGKQGVKKALKDLTLKETVGGSPVKLPKPSRIVEAENELPFLQPPDDIVGELMNLGSEKGGRFYNRQKPLSVSEWLERNNNLRNLWEDTGQAGGLPRPTELVRRYLPLPTEPGLNIPTHIRELLIKRQTDPYAGFGTDEFSKITELERRFRNNAEFNSAQRRVNSGLDNYRLLHQNADAYDGIGGEMNKWHEGFRIVDSPTQTRLPYFSKIADDINKGLAERLAGKEMQLQVEPTNYGFKTNIKGKVGDVEYTDWRQAGTMGLNPSGNALTKGDMLLKPVTDAQNGVDAVFANSSFPFSSLPNTNALIGKGYGKELYRQLNASLKKEYGTRLNSGHNSLSEHSRALWNSLVDKGEAWRIGDPKTTVQYGLYGGLLGTILAGQKEK